ncbi:hypothetical protein OEZ49_18395 [Ruegeria sp. WL0004]|uniref:Uncharacterized protein n=1 Tax=Ruegeria marisflavi TaxID=2984152 RepID=A0ABT2WV32_9RHOB|nr:hypothetical protein [Ruegeria sp. WL0004]MCU9839748.1 hypothetical protein [Ruegeria sp. WL0004]
MLDILLFLIAGAAQSSQGEDKTPAPTESAAAEAPAAPAFLTQAPSAEAPAAPVFLSPAPQLVAEPQVPSGKFTTATEVKPILNATRGNWVALRDYDGQDLLYVTHLWSWRCGLAQMTVAINGAAPEVWPLPPCHAETAAPNAIIESDGLPFRSFPSGSVAQIEVELIYDDLSADSASFARAQVLMP